MMTRTYDKEQIYDTYYPKVVQYIRSHVGQQQDVEDLAQAVFIKVYGKLDLFDPEKSGISTWIYNITRNTVIDHFRTMSHHQHEELSETLKDERGDVSEKVVLEEELEELA
ncbi:RNA polymerase sigma factor, partial [Frisingicoccus sp.]